jgi:hypothetical protein
MYRNPFRNWNWEMAVGTAGCVASVIALIVILLVNGH